MYIQFLDICMYIGRYYNMHMQIHLCLYFTKKFIFKGNIITSMYMYVYEFCVTIMKDGCMDGGHSYELSSPHS